MTTECICEGLSRYFTEENYPILWEVVKYIKTVGGYRHLRLDIFTWTVNDSKASLEVKRRKVDVPPSKGPGPARCMGVVHFFEDGSAKFYVDNTEKKSVFNF